MGMFVFKMFNKGLKCRGYQFNMGVNECEHATCVKEGFHAAENPLDCLSYYPSWDNAECYLCYAEGIHEDGSDSKISCTHLEILQKLELPEFVANAVDYIFRHPKREFNTEVKREFAETNTNHFAIVIGKSPKALATKAGDVIALLPENEKGDLVGRCCFFTNTEKGRIYEVSLSSETEAPI